jgi:hypothetical protein
MIFQCQVANSLAGAMIGNREVPVEHVFRVRDYNVKINDYNPDPVARYMIYQ